MHSKQKHWQNEKTIYWMGVNIRKWYDNKGSIYKIYKQIIQLNQKKKKTKQWEDLNFSKKDMQVTNRHMKNYWTSLNIREMEIKITRRYHLTAIRMAIIKSKCLKITNVGKDVEKRKPLYIIGGNVNLCSHYGKHHGNFPKRRITMWPSNFTPRYISEENEY